MATFMLVGGFWLGGWAWDRVADRLQAAGHKPRAVTLTGLGDRVHLARPDVGVATHVEDVVNSITRNDLQDVVLVGHSYGSMPITGAALRVPDRIARLVYIDSGPLPPGVSLADLYDADGRALIERLADEGDGWRFRLPDWPDLAKLASLDGVAPAELERWRRLAAPQPRATFSDTLRDRLEGLAALPCTLISCELPLTEVHAFIAAGQPLFAAMAGANWSFGELPTGHWPMFSRPDDLADLLASLG